MLDAIDFLLVVEDFIPGDVAVCRKFSMKAFKTYFRLIVFEDGIAKSFLGRCKRLYFWPC